MDASTGVTNEVYKRQKDFVRGLATHFNLSPLGPRSAALIYGNSSNTVSDFRDPDLNTKIDRAILLNTPRRMDRALESAAQFLRRYGRKGRNIVILLTAGRQAAGGKELDEAVKPLLRLEAQTFVVAIGQQADPQELTLAVERVQDLFRVRSPRDLPSRTRPIAEKIRQKPRRLLTLV